MIQDLQFAARMLVKDKWFTLVAVLALGLGIGLNATVFTFVNAVLIRGLPFHHPEQIFHIERPHHREQQRHRRSRGSTSRSCRGRTKAFTGLAAYRGRELHGHRERAAARTDPGRVRHRQHVHVCSASSRSSAATFMPGRRQDGRRPGRDPRLRRLAVALRRRRRHRRPHHQGQRHRLHHRRGHAGGHEVPEQRRPVAAAGREPETISRGATTAT